MDYSPPGSSVHGIFQARVLEWGAIAFSVTAHIPPLIALRNSLPHLLQDQASPKGSQPITVRSRNDVTAGQGPSPWAFFPSALTQGQAQGVIWHLFQLFLAQSPFFFFLTDFSSVKPYTQSCLGIFLPEDLDEHQHYLFICLFFPLTFASQIHCVPHDSVHNFPFPSTLVETYSFQYSLYLPQPICVFFTRVFLWTVYSSLLNRYFHVVAVQLLSHVPLFPAPWTAAHQASLSFTISQSLLKLISTESVIPSTISSSVILFSSCLLSFPESGNSFPMDWLFASFGQSIKSFSFHVDVSKTQISKFLKTKCILSLKRIP